MRCLSTRSAADPSPREPPPTPTLIAYGTDSGEAVHSAPEVPLSYPLAAIILEVAPVQTQTLTQTDVSTEAEPDAETDVLAVVPAQGAAAHHPEAGPPAEE
ncbi:RNA polymerase sigma factor, partial [Streptomyces sp. S6]